MTRGGDYLTDPSDPPAAQILQTQSTPTSTGRERVADHLQRQAVGRLRLVAWGTLIGMVATWLVVNLFQGSLLQEFEDILEWGFPAAIIAASAGMLWLTRVPALTPATVLRFGLLYQVIISLGIAGSTLVGAFEGIDPAIMQQDRIGLTIVGPWMLFFSVLVPAPPREALVALVASAAATPLVYLIQVPSGLAPPLPLGTFITVMIVPYLLTAVLAYMAARIVHRLGVEVRRANELGSYRLEQLLGRGGMGEVWRASHRSLVRPAAIKLIRPDVLDRDPAAALSRFRREAQAIASLQSPNTIALYDYGSTQEGTLYYVMELLDGVDLEHLVQRQGPLVPERVVHVLRQVCTSLGEAHSRGIIHRDIKPANIYLCRRGTEYDVVKVLDFGLVKHVDTEQRDPLLSHGDSLAGTPAYLAPEFAEGGPVDQRADLYAVGCVAYWLLTGRLVFEAPSAAAMIVAHARDDPRPPSSASPYRVPEKLDRIVLDCLAKNPDERPSSAEVLADRLAAVSLDQPWTARDAARWWETHEPAAPVAAIGGV